MKNGQESGLKLIADISLKPQVLKALGMWRARSGTSWNERRYSIDLSKIFF
jgi:hypothetical protein